MKAQKRKGRFGPTLPAENGNLFLAKSRLPPCHSTRFLSFEVLTRFGLIITSALLSSRWCTILLEATIVQVPASILGALLAACRTPKAYEMRPAIPSSFHHPSAVSVFTSPTEAEYKTSFVCTAVMVMPVSLAGGTYSKYSHTNTDTCTEQTQCHRRS